MPNVFPSATGARVIIASNDHCPPHVHAGHKEEGWVIRLWFSFTSDDVGVLSIAPTEHAVRRRQLNQICDELAAELIACRELWWNTQKTTCVDGMWALRVPPNDVTVLNERQAGAGRLTSATYDPRTRMTEVTLADGTRGFVGRGEGR
jgi:hypothetical protein